MPSATEATNAAHAAVITVWRMEAAKVIAAVACLTHELGAAEDLAADALVAALEHWPRHGVPANPGAWLTTTVWLHAASLTRNARERALLLDRSSRCEHPPAHVHRPEGDKS